MTLSLVVTVYMKQLWLAARRLSIFFQMRSKHRNHGTVQLCSFNVRKSFICTHTTLLCVCMRDFFVAVFFSQPRRWPSGEGVCLESGRFRVGIPLEPGFSGAESYQ